MQRFIAYETDDGIGYIPVRDVRHYYVEEVDIGPNLNSDCDDRVLTYYINVDVGVGAECHKVAIAHLGRYGEARDLLRSIMGRIASGKGPFIDVPILKAFDDVKSRSLPDSFFKKGIREASG